MSATPLLLHSLKVIGMLLLSLALVTATGLRSLAEDEMLIRPIAPSISGKTMIWRCSRSNTYLFTISLKFPLADIIVELYNRIQSHHKHVVRSERRTVYI